MAARKTREEGAPAEGADQTPNPTPAADTSVELNVSDLMEMMTKLAAENATLKSQGSGAPAKRYATKEEKQAQLEALVAKDGIPRVLTQRQVRVGDHMQSVWIIGAGQPTREMRKHLGIKDDRGREEDGSIVRRRD